MIRILRLLWAPLSWLLLMPQRRLEREHML